MYTHNAWNYKILNLVKTHLQAKPKYTLLSEIIYDTSRYMVIAMDCYWRNSAAAKRKKEAMFSNSISCNRCAEQSIIHYKQIKPYEARPIGLNHRMPVEEMFSRLAFCKVFGGMHLLSMLVSCSVTMTSNSVTRETKYCHKRRQR